MVGTSSEPSGASGIRKRFLKNATMSKKICGCSRKQMLVWVESNLVRSATTEVDRAPEPAGDVIVDVADPAVNAVQPATGAARHPIVARARRFSALLPIGRLSDRQPTVPRTSIVAVIDPTDPNAIIRSATLAAPFAAGSALAVAIVPMPTVGPPLA